MSRLRRPYVPLKVRCRVALRQLGELWPDEALKAHENGLLPFLDQLLFKMAGLLACEVLELQLDHDPALENRPFSKRTRRYSTDANDPEFLVYRTQQAHKIKTLVRGDGAQLSDAAIARKRKRKERKAKRPRTRWASRPLRSAGRFPKRKMR